VLRGKTAKTARRARAVRTRRSAQDLLDRIVEAAGEEFKRCGYAGTTTAAVARRADVTEAQLFRYFGSKSNLFRETIFKPLDEQLVKFINQHRPEIGDPDKRREGVGLYTTALQHFIRENAGTLTSLVVAQLYDPGAVNGVGKINSLANYFAHGAATMKTYIKGKPKVDPRLMVRLSFVAVLGTFMFRNWIFPGRLVGDAELESALNDFVMEGVGANDPR
jgi:AcrR family transcriptional regulator